MSDTARVIAAVAALWASLNLTGLMILIHLYRKEGR